MSASAPPLATSHSRRRRSWDFYAMACSQTGRPACLLSLQKDCGRPCSAADPASSERAEAQTVAADGRRRELFAKTHRLSPVAEPSAISFSPASVLNWNSLFTLNWDFHF